jgi:hypothetical protein
MNQKIVIKANVVRDTEHTPGAVSYQWHWHRIVSVIMFVLMTTAAIVYGLTMSVNAEQNSSENETLNLDSENEIQEEVLDKASFDVNQPSSDILNSEGSEDVRVSEELTQSILKDSPINLEDGSSEPQLEKKDIKNDLTNEKNVVTSVEPAQQAQGTGETTTHNNKPSDRFSASAHIASVALDAKVDTNQVSRAVLTRAVSKREPVNVFAADVRLKEFNEALTFFSELKNMQGQQVKHIWRFEGAIVAEIPLLVTTPRYRTFSTKKIMDSQLGNWQVDVVDESGNLIAQKEFRILAD